MIRCADEGLYRSKQEGRDRSTGLEILISHPISAAG
jgi:hypothetical protein